MSVSRLRLIDMRLSRFPEVIGVPASDLFTCALKVNECQERLLTCIEAGDTGWYGGYAEMAFSVTKNNPYLTLPRGVARAIRLNACEYPIRLQNQFYEYLEFGSGRWPKINCSDDSSVCKLGPQHAYRRNTVPTFVEPTGTNFGLRIYVGSAADVNLRVLVGCTDSNDQTVYTMDSGMRVNGCFATLTSPFIDLTLPDATTALSINSILSIQKDVTFKPVSFYQVDLTTGDQTLLLTMEPSETVAAYTRYYLNNLPDGCCPDPSDTSGDSLVQLKAMCKLDLVPASVDTDYLLIQSKEALIAEAESTRLMGMDSGQAKTQAAALHKEAVRYLNGQLKHYEGQDTIAVSFKPFRSNLLGKQRIGTLI